MDSDAIFECIDSLIKSDKSELLNSSLEYNRQENLASDRRLGIIIPITLSRSPYFLTTIILDF